MMEATANPLPALLGWDDASSSFRTATHNVDIEANRQSFPFLYADIDQPDILKSSAETLQHNATAFIQQHYQLEHDIDIVLALKLVNHWDRAWATCGLDSAFLLLAAYKPELVIRLHVLLRDFMRLKDVDDLFPSFKSYNYASRGDHALFLLENQTLVHYPYNYDWSKAFNAWKDDTSLSQLRDRLGAFQTGLQKPRESWMVLKKMTEDVEREIPLQVMEQLRQSLEATFGFFDKKIEDCRNTITALERDEEAKRSLVPEPGIFKTPSISSAIEVVSIDMSKLRPRTAQAKGPDHGPKKLQKEPRRMGRGGNNMASKKRSAAQEPKLWRTLGLSLVTWLVVVSLPFIVLATFLCEAAEGVPMYDSNFHSTLSQQLLGFGGLYAIVKPQLMQWFNTLGWLTGEGKPPKGIETKWPITFNGLVILAFVTLLASSPIYPYYPQSSIPLGAFAAICANIATLLIIEDTESQIVEQEYRIEEQSDEILDLNYELEGLRRRG
ncbi:hypothetical protein CORC01_00534 [Colletotrichum orchidophilum]|uniref:Uncharacterized protein n=1 Tax=Colletotrichum orchidophilum TaxID=1209926 RepID=A0A1G4BS92_9PEZI|nr:uncharacterized protein CORC01_00534 [Colletotrichum orchidophilum]OHF04195.1 hypothetical protein CORC01_00534 [Colletotrichum orchidophilum]